MCNNNSKVQTETGTKRRRFPQSWREAAVFGALWGAGEVTLGTFLTATRIPMTGIIMSCFGVIILTAGQMLIGRRWFALRTALVCAGLRSLSPGSVIFGPMFAIVMQGLIVSLTFYFLRRPLLAGIISGFIVVWSSMLQGVAVKLIVYGASLWEICLNLLDRAENLFHLQSGQGWMVIILFFLVFGLVGSIAGAFGWKLGNVALLKEKQLYG